MYPFYDVLLVPLYIFALLLCLFVQMLQQSTLESIGVAPNIFSLILGTFCYFANHVYNIIFDTDRCGGAEISICICSGLTFPLIISM